MPDVYARAAASSQIVSLLWVAVSGPNGKWNHEAKAKLAEAGIDVEQLDRMFSSSEPRISLRRTVDVLSTLGLSLKVEAIAEDGSRYNAAGLVR